MGNRRVLFLNAEEQQGYEELELDVDSVAAPYAYVVAAGDFDGDGRDDIVTSFANQRGWRSARSGLALHSRDAEGVWRTG